MPRLNPLDAVSSVTAELAKEGNTIARTKVLPKGRNAEKDYDAEAFTAGLRYGLSKVNAAVKSIRAGTFKRTDTAKKAPSTRTTAARVRVSTPKAPASGSVTDIDTARAKTKVVQRRVAQ